MKPVLVVATSNAGKIKELRRLLRGLGIRIDWLGSGHFAPMPPPHEGGKDFLENACRKAAGYSRRLRMHVFSEDSGLCVTALDEFPGVRSARFLGAGKNDQERCRRLLQMLTSYRRSRERKAWFEAAGAIADPEGRIVWTDRGRCWGWISYEAHGSNGFGYDPIFYFPPLKMTFAELTAVEKNRVSHRAQLISKLHRFLIHWPSEIRGRLGESP